jgi:hypothetical protein
MRNLYSHHHRLRDSGGNPAAASALWDATFGEHSYGFRPGYGLGGNAPSEFWSPQPMEKVLRNLT